MKHNPLRTGLLATAVLFSFAAGAQSRQLSLQEAIRLSLDHSSQLRADRAKIDEAVASFQEARQRRLPDLTLSGSYLRLANPTVDLKVQLGGGSSSSNSGGETQARSTPKVDQAAYGIANASFPVFTGYRIKAAIESSKYLEQAARLDADRDREELISNVIGAYLNVYKSRAALNLVIENRKQSQQRVTDFANLETNGVIPRNDLLKVQLQESNIELSLLEAENNLKITTLTLNLLTGLPDNTEIATEDPRKGSDEQLRSAADWEAIAFQNRKDAAALDIRRKAQLESIRSAKSEYYPNIALTGGYIAANIPNFLVLTNAANIGVGLNYSPSSFWKTPAKVKQYEARVAQTEASQVQLQDNIRVQVTQAYENYVVSRKKIEVYQRAVEQSKENYRISKNKYDNSLLTTTDLLDADIAQLQTQLNYAAAIADQQAAYARLQEAAGVLNENR